jgi:hypothetical protein
LAPLTKDGVVFEQPTLMNGDNGVNGEQTRQMMLTTDDNDSLSNAAQDLCVELASEPVQDAAEHAGNTTEKRLRCEET